MKKNWIMFVALISMSLMVVACGKGFEALKSKTGPELTLPDLGAGNAANTAAIQAAMIKLAEQHFGKLFSSEDQQNQSKKFKKELLGAHLVVSGAESTRSVQFPVVQKNCTPANFQVELDKDDLYSISSPSSLGIDGQLSAQILCIPSKVKGKDVCRQFVVAVTKKYSETSSGSALVLLGNIDKQSINFANVKVNHKFFFFNKMGKESCKNNGNSIASEIIKFGYTKVIEEGSRAVRRFLEWARGKHDDDESDSSSDDGITDDDSNPDGSDDSDGIVDFDEYEYALENPFTGNPDVTTETTESVDPWYYSAACEIADGGWCSEVGASADEPAYSDNTVGEEPNPGWLDIWEGDGNGEAADSDDGWDDIWDPITDTSTENVDSDEDDFWGF